MFCPAPARALLVCALAMWAPVHGATLVAPTIYEKTEASGANCIPFGCAGFSRYQQIYASSHFPGEPIAITGLAFRPDLYYRGTAFNVLLQDVTMRLSTTSRGPGQLEPDFETNLGTDTQTVLSTATLSLSGTVSATKPRTFSVILNLTSAFAYDPSSGNLLLDVNIGGAPASALSLDAFSGTVSQRAFGNASGSSYVDSTGLVTQFRWEEMPPAHSPEPGTMVLCVTAVLACWAGARRNRRARRIFRG